MHFACGNSKTNTLFCPIRPLIFVFGLLASSGALAYTWTSGPPGYQVSWGLVNPTAGVMGASVPITFDYTLDMRPKYADLISIVDNVTGEVRFGNGLSEPFSFRIAAGAGGITKKSIPFSNQYVFPGNYQIGGTLKVNRLACLSTSCYTRSGPDWTWDFLSTSINIGKSSEYSALHRARAYDAGISMVTWNLFGWFSGFGSAIDLTSSYIAGAAEATGTKWGTVLSVGLGTIGAGLIGGPYGLLLGSTITTMAAYYEVTRIIETKLADDPPDWDYQHIYQYSNATLDLDLGLGADVNAYYQEGFAALSRLAESRQGELTSMERGQGALLAGDTVAAAAHAAAAQAFASDYTELAQSAGTWIGSLPEFLRSNGVDAVNPYADIAYSVLTETALQLKAPVPAVPEASTNAMLALGLGALGIAARRRKAA